MVSWATGAPAITSAFLASLVEVVEAFTVVLAVSTIRGYRPAVLGSVAGLLLLGLLVIVLGPMLNHVPLDLLQIVIGVLLLLFGMRWLRTAILRTAGAIPLRDEQLKLDQTTADLKDDARGHQARIDWLAGITAFKAVVLEGLEVVFIVIAIGAGRGLLIPASLGALAAFVLILIVGIVVRRPLARVPENTLKFGVGLMLTAFGVFWTGEGLGVNWPGSDVAILGFVIVFLLVAVGSIAFALRLIPEIVI